MLSRTLLVLGLVVSAASGVAQDVSPTEAHAPEPAPLDRDNLPRGWRWPPSPAMVERSEACLEALTTAGVDYVRVSQDRMFVGNVTTPVWVRGGQLGPLIVRSVRTGRAPVMDCEMALTLRREADKLTSLGVRELLVGRVINDRRARLAGGEVNLRSRHSLGLALDVRGFITKRGQRLTVLRDYAHPFVQRVESWLLASESFRAVVTQRNDPGHDDHFHLSAKLSLNPHKPEAKVDVEQLLQGRTVTELSETADTDPAH